MVKYPAPCWNPVAAEKPACFLPKSFQASTFLPVPAVEGTPPFLNFPLPLTFPDVLFLVTRSLDIFLVGFAALSSSSELSNSFSSTDFPILLPASSSRILAFSALGTCSLIYLWVFKQWSPPPETSWVLS